ncbi:MAG: hotdog fold thioesterase [Ornithinimicrobium sp.]|uniref:hotdog fold thioesterase n=1 Tax=Ornithinimicrobium sp. TaxID=1977084 RepID=UPI003D9BFBC1
MTHNTPPASSAPESSGGPDGAAGLVERMQIEITTATAERTEGHMPVRGNTQPYGLLHGGASVVLAETLGSMAAALHAGPDRVAVGVDVNATHHRAARSGRVHGVATPISRGRSVACYEIAIADDEGRRVCTARLTCALRDRAPGG